MGRFDFKLWQSRSEGADCECVSTLVEESEDEKKSQNENKSLHRYEASKERYLLFFIIWTTIIACFCIFVVIPQLINFTSPNVSTIENSIYDSEKLSVIDTFNTERYRRNQERLEIMQRFSALQQNYKLLQKEYQTAQENYLKKLHSAQQSEENLEPEFDNSKVELTSNSSEESKLKMFNSGVINIQEDKNEKPLSNEIFYNVVV